MIRQGDRDTSTATSSDIKPSVSKSYDFLCSASVAPLACFQKGLSSETAHCA